MQIRPEVDAYNVSFMQSALTRDAVYDLLVNRDTCRAREPAVSLKGRLRTPAYDILIGDLIQLFCRYAVLDRRDHFIHRRRGNEGCRTHPFDLFW